MSIFHLLRRVLSLARSSEAFQEFQRNFIAASDSRLARDGLDEDVLARLTSDERLMAERMLLSRLKLGDSRPAIGLGLLRSTKAAGALRRLMAAQGHGPFASPAYALALWRITGDPDAIDAVAAIARDPRVHGAPRVDAVVALAKMPAVASRMALHELLESEPDYLLRYHAFKGLLLLHGYSWREADDHAGALARPIADSAADPTVRARLLTRLRELLAGRTIVAQP